MKVFNTHLIKHLLSLLFIFIFTLTCWSQEETKSSKAKLKAKGSVSLNSNGIAYIPAFSLGKPAIIGSFSLVKNRFSYDPQLSYGLDLRPWIIDNWMHYKLIARPSFELIAGGVISAFFSDYETQDEVLKRAQRYFALETTGVYKWAPNASMSFTYLRDMGADPGTLKGHFVNLGIERSEIKLGDKGLLMAAIQIFYIDYTGNNDGLFVSPKASLSISTVPFSLFVQAIQALQSNIDPFPGFNWNVGMVYTL